MTELGELCDLCVKDFFLIWCKSQTVWL